jgi:hypothetical protein
MKIREQIKKEHEDSPHAGMRPETLKVHLIIHEMVEAQLDSNEPPETLVALTKLIDKGLSRHQAIHAIGEAIARQAFKMMKENKPLDLQAYKIDLKSIIK